MPTHGTDRTGQMRDHQQTQELKSLKGHFQAAGTESCQKTTQNPHQHQDTGEPYGLMRHQPGQKLNGNLVWCKVTFRRFLFIRFTRHNPVKDVRLLIVSQQLRWIKPLSAMLRLLKGKKKLNKWDQNIFAWERTACVPPWGMLSRWAHCNCEAIFHFWSHELKQLLYWLILYFSWKNIKVLLNLSTKSCLYNTAHVNVAQNRAAFYFFILVSHEAAGTHTAHT